ncbi:hypothetical protein [Sinimarinibacterium thermocellulolyticum]|uniref:Uncharacterized protein n=1 Tax=Sinimarinibacterium thermocellulolyticum TaxID=3170016 RepID=A0ABV2A8M3_9GAMM
MSHTSGLTARFVYVVHGHDDFHLQTRYSLLTLLHLLRHTPGLRANIHVYTDRPQWIPDHALIVVHRLDAGQLRAWRGPLDYVHRIKLEVLRRAVREIGTPLVAVDGDTRWCALPWQALHALNHPPPDARPAVFFHVFEESIGLDPRHGYSQLLNGHTALLRRLGVRSAGPWPSWNVGAIGVPAQAQGLFDHALSINDALLPLTALRRTVEQLALSLAADAAYDVRALDDGLTHYWNYGIEWPMRLRAWFAEQPPDQTTEDLAAACASWQPAEVELLALRQSAPYRRLLRRSRYRRSLRKRITAMRAWWLRLRQGHAPAVGDHGEGEWR